MTRAGRRSPRELRDAIRAGLLARNGFNSAPGNWPQWRQKRMAVAIQAANLFLEGERWHGIVQALVAKRMVRDADITKSRALQYVARGCKYLAENGGFSSVHKK